MSSDCPLCLGWASQNCVLFFKFGISLERYTGHFLIRMGIPSSHLFTNRSPLSRRTNWPHYFLLEPCSWEYFKGTLNHSACRCKTVLASFGLLTNFWSMHGLPHNYYCSASTSFQGENLPRTWEPRTLRLAVSPCRQSFEMFWNKVSTCSLTLDPYFF